jgi:subtilisin family serine protease
VRTPGTAFNVVTVGSFDEATNTMSGFSSGADPISAHGDREKPEVAAPGQDFISTTNASPWLGGVGSGTSYAAPMVTGTTALMMQRNTALQFWPEGVRAILMASATNPVGSYAVLDELRGAGGIYADYADDVVTGVRGGWGGFAYNCGAAPSTAIGSMALTAGYEARVAISWDTDPNYASYGSRARIWILSSRTRGAIT